MPPPDVTTPVVQATVCTPHVHSRPYDIRPYLYSQPKKSPSTLSSSTGDSSIGDAEGTAHGNEVEEATAMGIPMQTPG
jgi:hypothetical protein